MMVDWFESKMQTAIEEERELGDRKIERERVFGAMRNEGGDDEKNEIWRCMRLRGVNIYLWRKNGMRHESVTEMEMAFAPSCKARLK